MIKLLLFPDKKGFFLINKIACPSVGDITELCVATPRLKNTAENQVGIVGQFFSPSRLRTSLPGGATCPACAVRRSSRCALESRSDCFRASDNTGYPVPICAPMLCRNWFSATTASSAYSSDKLFTYLARETRIGGVTHVMGGARLRVWRSVRLLRRVFPSNFAIGRRVGRYCSRSYAAKDMRRWGVVLRCVGNCKYLSTWL